MILTWKLWRTLREPPPVAHALYKRSVSRQPLPIRLTFDQRMLWLLLAPVVLYVVFRHGVLSLLLVLFIVPAGGVLAFVLLPVILPVFTSVIGGFWAASISGSLVHERTRHTYDLVCVSPNGTLGANWAIASGCLHRGEIFDVLRFGIYISLMIGGMFLGIVALVVVFLAIRSTTSQTLVMAARVLMDLSAALLLFWMHYVQSMVLSVLVGVYVPSRFERLGDAPWLAFGLFEVLQIGTYLIYALARPVLDPLLSGITPDVGLAYVGLPFFYLAFFIVMREVIILWLWHRVTNYLNVGSAEREVLMRSFGWS